MMFIWKIVIVIIVIILIIIASIIILIYFTADVNTTRTQVNLPSHIISSKTYYKCVEKYHNKPTGEVIEKHLINRISDQYNCDLYIPCGYNLVEAELYLLSKSQKLKPTTIIYGIVGCDNIVSKNNIWTILEDFYGRLGATRYMPLTYIVDNNEHIDELIKQHHPGSKYILKKNIQRKRGLLITDSLKVINNAEEEDFKIIQKYIKQPLLINKRKLNIRIYVAVIYKFRKTHMYLYKEGKCIYTNKDYIVDGDDKDFERNITSFNLSSDIYLKNPLLLQDLRNYLNENHKIGDKLLKDIYILMKNVCLPIKPEICNNYPNIIDNTCFQLFGGDIIVTKDYKPLLLEFNKGPSMTTDIDIDQKMKKGLIEDTFKLAGVIVTDDKSYLSNFKEI